MILPPATLGMLGGGQLGRFFVSAAHEMGYKVWVLDPDPASPAGLIADRHLCAGYDDADALDALAQACAAVTTEFENVPAQTLARLAHQCPVHPSAASVSVCQNRIAEKTFLATHHLPHGPFAVIQSVDDLEGIDQTLFPGVLKVARFGYDGKGQVRVGDDSAAAKAFADLGQEPCVLERLLPLDAEVSVVLARDAQGQIRCFPAVENAHRNGILDVSIAPARLSGSLLEQAQSVAERIATALDYVGTLAVEFFVSGGALYVNEMAPRPHNSGHHTLDACMCSQYEQQVRALTGLPLGEPLQHSAAVMVNLLGELWFEGAMQREPDWAALCAVPGLHLHLYGKQTPRTGRKMGHFCVTGARMDDVLPLAMAARAAIGIGTRDGAAG